MRHLRHSSEKISLRLNDWGYILESGAGEDPPKEILEIFTSSYLDTGCYLYRLSLNQRLSQGK